MFWGKRTDGKAPRGFLMTLLRDARGNALIIMAAALIPLAGMVGGGIDVSRMYILKTRLQHACDAGTLAGRKAMGAGTWGFNNYYSRTQAEQFFDGNFEAGSFGSSALSRVFTENAGKVTGTVSAVIPMTLMRIFGRTTETIEVTCSSEMRLPNTDVMFVLDTTGSMKDPQPGDTVSKMAALKIAVKCFYEIVARLDTDATCTTGAPSGGTGDQVQIRFGFVPYATNVNVGKLLKPEWFADSWDYQTRELKDLGWNNGTPTVTSSQYIVRSTGSWSLFSSSTRTASSCNGVAVPANTNFVTQGAEGPSTEETTTGTFSGPTNTWFWATYQNGSYYEYQRVYNSSNSQCRIERRQVFADLKKQYQRVDQKDVTWLYSQLPVNVGLLKNGSSWNNSFQWGIDAYGANRTINWDGCIEERSTVSQSSYSPVPAGARDLDIDTVPTSSDGKSLWGMALPDLIYTRSNSRGWTTGDVTTPNDLGRDYYYACPKEATLLQTWPNADALDSYVDALSPEGNTYHDIGLIWGARLMSPDGLFADTNKFTAKGGEIDRNMIFMTDGDACTGIDNYTAYGVNWFDRRTTGTSPAPTDGCTQTGTLTQQVNARMAAVCSAIKNKNITLWVIAFGNLATSTETRLSRCATSGRYFKATNAAALQNTFKTIADQISMLRLTK